MAQLRGGSTVGGNQIIHEGNLGQALERAEVITKEEFIPFATHVGAFGPLEFRKSNPDANGVYLVTEYFDPNSNEVLIRETLEGTGPLYASKLVETPNGFDYRIISYDSKGNVVSEISQNRSL